MFNFRFFPGVDFTKINLDWIMRKIGLLEQGQQEVQEAAAEASAAAETATEAAETATEAAESAVEQIETVVTTANTALDTANTALDTANDAAQEASDANDLAQSYADDIADANATAQEALDSRINFTVFGSVSNDWTLRGGLTPSNGEIRYAISDNGRFIKIYGWQRFAVASNLGAGALFISPTNLPIIAPSEMLEISGCGLQIAHNAVDGGDVSTWKTIPGHTPYIRIYPSGTIAIEMDGIYQPYVTFRMFACLYQVSDFGDVPTP